MVCLHSNATAVDEFVRLQKDALEARGESSSDIMVNIFKGYLVAPDKEFGSYIKQKKNDCVEEKDLSEISGRKQIQRSSAHWRI